MTEEMDEFDRLLAERAQPITIMNLKDGSISTPYDRNDAKKQIAFGRAVETVPADPERAKQWLSDLRERVVSEWETKEQRRNAKYHDHERPLPVFEDYEAWCSENGVRALPAEVAIVVRWMLARMVQHRLETGFAPRWAATIADFHHLTNHPPRNLAREVIASYDHAISFAKAKLRETVRNIHDIPRLAPAKAIEMFPDGIVPRRYDEIAA